jgi:hypothetical protein
VRQHRIADLTVPFQTEPGESETGGDDKTRAE